MNRFLMVSFIFPIMDGNCVLRRFANLVVWKAMGQGIHWGITSANIITIIIFASFYLFYHQPLFLLFNPL